MPFQPTLASLGRLNSPVMWLQTQVGSSIMMKLSRFIEGNPLSPNGGAGLQAWKNRVIEQTHDLEKVQQACKLRVAFRLSDEAYRTAPPFGPDLDNLLKPFLDALKVTVLQPCEDACIVSLEASKSPAGLDSKPGALLEIEAIGVSTRAT